MWNQWHDFDRMTGAMDMLRARMNRLLADFDRSYDQGYGVPIADRTPHTNLYDQGDQLRIIAEVPGMSKDDLTVKIQGNYLELSGTRRTDSPDGYQSHRIERMPITFSRSFTLPYEIDADKVEACLQNGILTLSLPKSESAKPKQIAIGE